jgi:hypothetical protein
MPSPTDLATLKIDDFAPHLDAVFDMQSTAGVMPLKLGHLATRRAQLPSKWAKAVVIFMWSAGR